MVVPNHQGFPTKNAHFGVFWGVPPFQEMKKGMVEWHKRKLQRRTSLTINMWTEWVKFVGTKCGPRIAAVFDFSYRFGLRASEVLRLKRGDIFLADATPYIRVKSTQASLGAHDQWLKDVLKRGYRVQRMRGHKYVEECFKIKEDGYIFTSRAGAKPM